MRMNGMSGKGAEMNAQLDKLKKNMNDIRTAEANDQPNLLAGTNGAEVDKELNPQIGGLAGLQQAGRGLPRGLAKNIDKLPGSNPWRQLYDAQQAIVAKEAEIAKMRADEKKKADEAKKAEEAAKNAETKKYNDMMLKMLETLYNQLTTPAANKPEEAKPVVPAAAIPPELKPEDKKDEKAEPAPAQAA